MPRPGAARRGSSCLSSTPWLGLLWGLLVLASIPVWYIFSSAAAGNTQQALQATDIGADVVPQVLNAFNILRVVVVVLLGVCLGLLLLTSVMQIASKMRRDRRGAACGYETFSALGTALLWLTLIGVVALVAVCTTWLVGAWGASALLGKASSISTSAEAAAQKAVDSAQQLVSDLKSTQLNILDGAPDDIKGSPWFKEYYKGVQDINATSLLPSNLQASSSNTSVCDPGCISLDVLAGLAGMENGCLCLTNTLQSLQQGLTLTRQNMLPALIAIAVCYLAASLLLIYFTSTSKTASHIRKNIKAYRSDQLATTQPRFGPSGSLDGPLYRVPADAAVDIHGVNHDGSNGQHKYRPNGINGHVNHLRDTEIGGFHATGVTDQDDGVGLRDTSSASAPPMSHLFGPRRPVIAANGGGSSGGVGTSSSLIQPPLQHR